jgi:putative oxidoreductase
MNKISRFLIRITNPHTLNGLLPNLMHLIPRLICGALLTFDFGASKFGMPWTPQDRELPLFEVIDWFVVDVREFGMPFSWAPGVFAWMGAASEAIGGLLLMFGLQTRIAAFFVTCTMLVAIFFQKWGDGLWNLLPAMGFLWMSIYSLILGSGKLGLDYLIFRRINLQ